ncbi:MAG: RyR domain-containing protein [Pseudomonadota bacterium]
MANDLEPIARVVHSAIRTWSTAHGQPDLPDWKMAPDWMKESTFASIRFVLENPEADAGAQHVQWMEQRQAQGWRYGPVRDEEEMTHPMLVPFEQLPIMEQKKDDLVTAIVKALA